jgi:uncharacterized protein (DUF885 family)
VERHKALVRAVSIDRRGFLQNGAALIAGVAATPLLASCKLESRRDLADDGFVQLRDRYFREQLTLNPVTATYLGGDGYDQALRPLNGRLRDYSQDSLDDEARDYRRLERTLGSIDPTLLTPSRRIDHSVIGAQVAFLKQLLETRYHERAVDTYVAEPFRGIDWQIQQMRHFDGGHRGDEIEWRLVVTRLSGIPPYLTVARANLEAGRRSGNMPDRRMVQRDGIAGSRANAMYFRDTLLAQARDFLGDRRFSASMLAGLAGAGDNAAKAYEDFATWLERTFPVNETVDRFALGREGYEWRMRTILRDERTAADLYEYGARQVEEYTQRIAEVAARIARDRGISLPFENRVERAWSIRRVMEDLSADSPASDEELLAWYRETGVRAVTYGREHEMFEIPSDYELDVVPTPPVLRGTIDAAYYPAPPFKRSGVGRFYLTLPENDPAALREHSRASVADTAIHEGFPGHDWHFKYMTQHASEISNVRWYTPGAVEDSSSMWADSMATEGWGLYAEELMAEPVGDRQYGFYTASEYLYELQGQLLRAARVRLDVGLHTKRMTYEEAVDYYTEHVNFFPKACERASRGTDPAAKVVCDAADRAIYRYSKWPTQAITYNLGKNAIVNLRESYRSRRGADYSAREFHERFMKMGTIPAGFFSEMFLTGL